jgi:hypothetical protein
MKHKSGNIWVSLLALLILIGVIFAALYFLGKNRNSSGTVTSDPVVYNGVAASQIYGVYVSGLNPLNVNVNVDDYSVKVIPKSGASLEYTVSNRTYNINQLEDLTDGFTISRADGKLTLVPVGGLEEILSAVLGTSVSVPSLDSFDYSTELFSCLILASDGSSLCTIDFGLIYSAVSGVELDCTGVVF